MEFKSLADLKDIAHITPIVTRLTRAQKIAIWVEALERDPARVLNPLPEIEWVAPSERTGLRVDGSPLSIALEQPALRAAGLSSDRLGEALAFFELSEPQAHDALCSCRYGRTMHAGAAAKRISKLAGTGLFASLRHWISQ
ncbi:MAG: hypothetical protein JWL62_903, partial [Hyphomicrobiales bacterium]|nr:hypothetical protein [Hyphomicrobiales bacterium]